MVLRLVILVGTLLVSPVAIADRVLLAGTGSGLVTIQAELQALGHAVTRTDSDTLPAGLASFDTVWVHTLAALSPSDIVRLAAFVEAGRGVYLNGASLPAAPSNANGEALVNATVIDGASITIGAAACPFVFNGSPNLSAVGQITTVPHAPTYMAFAAAGCIEGAAPANQVITGTGGIRVGAWRDADMMGGRGRIAVVMDANWAALGDPLSDEWVANLQRFLSGTLFASGFELGAPVADGILRCDSPVDGALVDLIPGNPVAISGTALGLSNVLVNGVAVAVAPDQTFTAPVTGRYGLNFVALSATDGAGATQTALCAFLGAAHWGAEGAQYDDALLFVLEGPALQKLTGIYPPWFGGPSLQQGINSSLLAANPVYVSGCGFGNCVTEVRYVSLQIVTDTGSVTVQLNASFDEVRLTVQQDLRMRVRVRRQLGGINLGTVEGDVLFTNASTAVSFDIGIDLASGRPVVGGETIINTDSGTVSFQFPGLEPDFVGSVQSIATDVLFGSLGPRALSGASGLFKGLLEGFEITLPPAGFPVGRLDGTANVTVAAATRSSVNLQNSPGTGFRLRLGTGLRVTSPPPPPNATGRYPLPPAAEPLPRGGVDAWSAAHVGTYNQVLQALWRVGLFDGTLDGAALDPGLPPGTSVSLQLRTMPVVTGFAPGDSVGLDVGALDLVVAHPQLPPGLRVGVGARMRAHAALVSNDLVCDNILADELRISTGTVVLDPTAQATLQGLVESLLVKIAGVALNDSLPVLPATIFTFPASLGTYGFPLGGQLLPAPALVIEPNHVFLQGNLSVGNVAQRSSGMSPRE